MGMTEQQLEGADSCKCKRLGDFDGKCHHPLCNESGQAPSANSYDLSDVIHLTHSKTKSIVERGYKITGFVLTDDVGRKCISDMSAVRWFDDRVNFFRMMHPDDNPPPASEQKPVDPWMNTNGAFINMKRAEQDALHGEAMDKLTAMVRSAQSNQPDHKAQRDAERYRELIMAVERKFPNESRHETALRYIKAGERKTKVVDAGMAKVALRQAKGD